MDKMKHLLTIFLVLIFNTLLAQEKTFEKEYSYRASELDSKISCRVIATNQLRSMLLGEIGVYVESEGLLKTSDVNGKFSQDFVENITTLSAGITKLVILDEKWNGETFWMKATITVDQKHLEESLKQLINDRQKVKELQNLRDQLKKANDELIRLKNNVNREQTKSNNPASLEKYNNEINKLNYADYLYGGFAKFEDKDFEGAIADFTKAIEINSDSADVFFGRGLAKQHLDDHVGALKDFNQAIGIGLEFEEVYYSRGLTKEALEDYQGAIADYNKAIKIKPDFEIAFYSRGVAKSELEDYLGAISDYNKAFEINPAFGKIYYDRGNAKSKVKDYKGAIADYTKAIEFEPDFASAYLNRGIAKSALDNFKAALADFNKAIQIKPEFANAYLSRGVTKVILKDKEGGCLDLSKAGELGNVNAYDVIKRLCR